jgi:biofilm protein TabA
MIFGHIGNLDKEAPLYPSAVQKGLQYLKNTDFAKLADGKHSIDGDSMYAIISEYFPDLKENRKAETHIKYIDIQYIDKGEEYIAYSNLSTTSEIAQAYSEEKDAAFYKNVTNEIDIKLSSGMYAVFFPWDIHRPGCVSQPGVKVRKVVVKIKVSDLY